jgi:putative peptidoglycan lipid II flippase
MATVLGPGSVSALNFGGKLIAFVLGVGAVALSAAVLPQFASLAAAGEFGVLEATLRTWSKVVIAVSVPVTAILMLGSHLIVETAFQRGAFTAHDTAVVAHVQTLFLVQIPFYLLGILVVRMISALHGNAYLMWGALLSVVINIGLNLILMNLIGVAGIALSTSLVYVISWAFLYTRLQRLLARRRVETAALS